MDQKSEDEYEIKDRKSIHWNPYTSGTRSSGTGEISTRIVTGTENADRKSFTGYESCSNLLIQLYQNIIVCRLYEL